MHKSIYFAVGAAAVLSAGCSSSDAAAKAPAFGQAAWIRLVNLTDADAKVMFGNYPNQAKSGEGSTFQRVPPRKIDVVATFTTGQGNTAVKVGEAKIPLDMQAKSSYTLYAIKQNGKIELVNIEKDQYQPVEDGKVAFRAISFASGDVDIEIKPDTGDTLSFKGVKPGEPSGNQTGIPQNFTVIASRGGKKLGEQSVEAKKGQAFSVAVYGDANPQVKVYLNNPKMTIAAVGGSEAG